MEAILADIQANVQYASYIIFGLLLFVGFNLLVSEDVMFFTLVILAVKNPEYKYLFFIGVFFGVYFSDFICYGFIGRYLGSKFFEIKFFVNMVLLERIEKVN